MLNLNILSGDIGALPITELMLARWLANAMPGDRLAYHRGHLAVDAPQTESRLPLEQRRELQRVAARALAAALQGKVHAVQHRHGESDYTYLLIARPRPQPARRVPHSVPLLLLQAG